MAPITFRNSKIIYYGPHPCENCGVDVAKMGHNWGGTAFTYPKGPIYPNTEWHPHVCDPADVWKHRGVEAKRQILLSWNDAKAVRLLGGWVVLAHGDDLVSETDNGVRAYMIISANMTYASDENGAWVSATERYKNNWPVWYLDEDTVRKERQTS